MPKRKTFADIQQEEMHKLRTYGRNNSSEHLMTIVPEQEVQIVRSRLRSARVKHRTESFEDENGNIFYKVYVR